jgi:hypothetical protein
MPSRAQKRKRSDARKHGTEAAKMRDGGTALLRSDEQVKSDAKLIVTAVEKRFPITQTIAKKLVRRLANVVEKTTVQIATKDGVFDCEATADKNAIAAGNALRAMAAMNQRDELEAIRRSNPKQQSQTVVNVGVNVDNRTDERRNRALAIAERFRDGRVLVSDSSGSDR